MNKKRNIIFGIGLRYLLLVIFGILNVGFFYLIFTPLTIYPVYFFLKFFFNALLVDNIILINKIPIEIIGACVAGAAYYLLLILNLATPKIKLARRIEMLFFSFALLLFVNILRIFSLSILFVSGVSFFDLAHKLFWYVGSIVFVVGIWFLSVKLFKVKEIPFYSDIKYLFNLRKAKK